MIRMNTPHVFTKNVGPGWFVWTHLTRPSYSLVFVHFMYSKISLTVKHLSTLIAFLCSIRMFGPDVTLQGALFDRFKVTFTARQQNVWVLIFCMASQCTLWIALIFALTTVENNISMNSFNMGPQIYGPCWCVVTSVTVEPFWSMCRFDMSEKISSCAFVITRVTIKSHNQVFLVFRACSSDETAVISLGLLCNHTCHMDM